MNGDRAPRLTDNAKRIAEVRIPFAGRVAVGLALVAFVAYVWISRNFQFYYDEWDFVLHPPSSPGAYFLPHNEHWSTVPLVVYQLLLHVFGMRTHVPFMATILAMHVLTCLVLFHLVRRRSGDALALCALLIMLVLGWGADDFLWAFQIGFEGSVLFGLVAIDLLDSPTFGRFRAISACFALLLSVASSGLGVAFLAAVGVEILLDRERRRRAIVLVVPAGAYLAWLLLVGGGNVHPAGHLLSVTGISQFARYILFGAGAGAAAVAGVGQFLGAWVVYAALAPLAVVVAIGLRRRWDSRILGSVVGILAIFGSAGLVRFQIGVTQAGSRRYTYVAVLLLLLLGTLAVGRLPWRRATALAVGALLAAGVVGNLIALRSPVAFWNKESVAQDVELRTVNALRGAPDLDRSASPDRVLMPQVTTGALLAAEDRIGEPVSSHTLQNLRINSPALVNGVMLSLFEHALRAQPADPTFTCTGTASSALSFFSGGSIGVQVTGSGSIGVAIGWSRPPSLVTTVQVSSGAWLIHVPDTGQPGFTWRVILQPSASLTLHWCGA